MWWTHLAPSKEDWSLKNRRLIKIDTQIPFWCQWLFYQHHHHKRIWTWWWWNYKKFWRQNRVERRKERNCEDRQKEKQKQKDRIEGSKNKIGKRRVILQLLQCHWDQRWRRGIGGREWESWNWATRATIWTRQPHLRVDHPIYHWGLFGSQQLRWFWRFRRHRRNGWGWWWGLEAKEGN